MMSDLSTNGRSSFDNVVIQNQPNSRPKFQPIRLKALLDFCESDDEDSEDRTPVSDMESDSEDPQPLTDNDSFTNSIGDSQKPMETVVASVYSSCEGNEEAKAANEDSYLSSSGQHEKLVINGYKEQKNSILLEKVTGTSEDATQEDHKSICSTSYHPADVIGNGQIDNGQHWVERNMNSEFLVDPQLCYENMCGQDKSDYKESAIKYMTNIESKRPMSNEIEPYVLVQKTEEHSIRNELHIKDHHNPCKAPSTDHNLVSLGPPCGSTLQPSNYNSQYSNVKLEAVSTINEDDSSKTQLSDTISVLNPAEHLVTETPLKHVVVGLNRPNPCFSRRNLVTTPQNKLQSDLSKSHGQTPATIQSNWSHSGITPLQSKNFHNRESLQTPKTSGYVTPSMTRNTMPRFFNTETKSVRRPLADTTSLMHNDASVFPLESKPRLLQGASQLSKVEEERPEHHNDFGLKSNLSDRCTTAKRMLPVSDSGTQFETNVKEQIKENKQKNTAEAALENRETQGQSKVTEGRHVSSINASLDGKSNPVKAHDKDVTAASKDVPIPHPAPSKQNDQQDLKQMMDKMSNVQFSVPSNNTNAKQDKTIFVKGREYLILGALGQGMSGEVLRVQDLSSYELCAIKCVNLSRMEKDSAQGCLQEISMLHKLQAPCVVKMFDYEIKFPMVYVVLEMGDTDLSRLLKSMSQDKQLPLTMILYYWTEMLTAVKHIHDNGVIHSDLKPANFLLVRGRLKLIDFGIASSMNADMTSVVKNCPIGTLNYISPEALMDIGGNPESPNHNVKYKISFKSDVWSLGCILYSLVYGHTPFHHIRSQWAKVSAITNPKPSISFPSTMVSSEGAQKSIAAPPILIDVMRKCLQRDPKSRPTVAQLSQIQYIPTKPGRALSSTPEIPVNILVKIKRTLNEDEWRQLTQILENRRQT